MKNAVHKFFRTENGRRVGVISLALLVAVGYLGCIAFYRFKLVSTGDKADMNDDILIKEISEKEFVPEECVINAVININTDDIDALTLLPGIGETLAGRIVEYREMNGKFTSIDDIMKVKGIGEGKFEAIKAYIYVK